LHALLERLGVTRVAFYWPMRDEVDVRLAMTSWLAAHAQRVAALPVARDVDAPLLFHRWSADTAMRVGRFGIAVPADEVAVDPQLLIIPCVGFDARANRLGYGGGFYDRTLAALSPRPQTLGIALACQQTDALPTEAHDLPLDAVLTESALHGRIAAHNA
jgi:5,10-methenyltetrahydrofolate synthetase